jgi:hypothetical protein
MLIASRQAGKAAHATAVLYFFEDDTMFISQYLRPQYCLVGRIQVGLIWAPKYVIGERTVYTFFDNVTHVPKLTL